MKSSSESYKAAGVDITAGYKAVDLMKKHIARTMTGVPLKPFALAKASFASRPLGLQPGRAFGVSPA